MLCLIVHVKLTQTTGKIPWFSLSLKKKNRLFPILTACIISCLLSGNDFRLDDKGRHGTIGVPWSIDWAIVQKLRSYYKKLSESDSMPRALLLFLPTPLMIESGKCSDNVHMDIHVRRSLSFTVQIQTVCNFPIDLVFSLPL